MSKRRQKSKVCPKCQKRKPLTAYARNATMADNLQWQCRQCFADYAEERKARRKTTKAQAYLGTSGRLKKEQKPSPASTQLIEVSAELIRKCRKEVMVELNYNITLSDQQCVEAVLRETL